MIVNLVRVYWVIKVQYIYLYASRVKMEVLSLSMPASILKVYFLCNLREAENFGISFKEAYGINSLRQPK